MAGLGLGETDTGRMLCLFASFLSVLIKVVGEACLSSNAYYPRTPDYTLYSGVNAC